MRTVRQWEDEYVKGRRQSGSRGRRHYHPKTEYSVRQSRKGLNRFFASQGIPLGIN